jgi:hypothetical protein
MIDWDSDIPAPNARKDWGIYPWKEMKIGDSFLIHGCTQIRVCTVAAQHAEKLNRKFTTQIQPDRSVRVWRTK